VRDEIESLKEEQRRKLRKVRARQKRLARNAWADGFLSGVCGTLRPGDIAIDLGANVGDISSRLLASGADVIAFDPEPWAIAALEKRFADEPRFTLHNAAVGCAEGTVSLMRADDFDGDEAKASVKSTIVEGGRAVSGGQFVEVRMINFVDFLRNLVARHGDVQFIKMDIEGAELDLLDALDAADLLNRVRCIVVETHERKFKDQRARFSKQRRRLSAKYAPTHINLDWI